MGLTKKFIPLIAITVISAVSGAATADTIAPESYTTTLGLGESVTIRKTVVVEDAPSEALIDVMFLFDTTGSMGSEISAAKTQAGDILTGLAGFGNVASGTGWYNDPSVEGLVTDLTTDQPTAIANINAIPGASGGGDADELGVDGIVEASDATWRTGSNRFVIAFGDAAFKGDNQEAIDALDLDNSTFLGVGFTGGGSDFFSDADPIAAATGGSTLLSSTGTGAITAAILALVEGSLAEYTEVTVDDLGAGLPGVGVSVVCVGADTGACVGDTATGTYDRSIDRSFEFDVTFTGLTAGVHGFGTHALVDGGIVATEKDEITVRRRIPGGDIPEPATMALLLTGLAGVLLKKKDSA